MAKNCRFGRELYIERNDFMIDRRKYFTFSLEKKVRLMHTYFVKCVSYETDAEGNVTVVHCTYMIQRQNAEPGLPDVGKRNDPLGKDPPQAKKAEVII